MKQQFRLFKRNGVFYSVDSQNGCQQSLRTKSKDEAIRLLNARNEAHRQPLLNLQIARTYIAASDPEALGRTWEKVMTEAMNARDGETRKRWERAIADPAFESFRQVVLLETRAEQMLRVLKNGTISTNMFLRRMHNFALDMGWLPWPILRRNQWPPARHKEQRAVTAEEHRRIIAIEWLPERRAYYQLLWHVGGSQSDVALLRAEDIDWSDRTIGYARCKTKQLSLIHFSGEVATILKPLPASGYLFPRIAQMNERHRSAEFRRRTKRLKIQGVTLHSYRYAWAERAKSAGMPERFAQEALGHNSKAVHRAYAKKAIVKVPALEEYEKANASRTVVAVEFPKAEASSGFLYSKG